MTAPAVAVAIFFSLCSISTCLVQQEQSYDSMQRTQQLMMLSKHMEQKSQKEGLDRNQQDLLRAGAHMFQNMTIVDMVRNAGEQWDINSKQFKYHEEDMERDLKPLMPSAQNVVSLLQTMSDHDLRHELNRTDSQAMRMMKTFEQEARMKVGKNPVYEIEGTNVNLQYGTYPKCNPGPLSKFYVNGNAGPLLCYRFGHTFEDGMELYWNTYDVVKYGFGISLPHNYPLIPNTACSDHRPIFFTGFYPNIDWKPAGGFQHPRPSFKYNIYFIFDSISNGHTRPRFSHSWVQYTKYSDTINPQEQQFASDIEVWFMPGWWGLEGHAWDCRRTLGWKAFWCNNEYFLEA